MSANKHTLVWKFLVVPLAQNQFFVEAAVFKGGCVRTKFKLHSSDVPFVAGAIHKVYLTRTAPVISGTPLVFGICSLRGTSVHQNKHYTQADTIVVCYCTATGLHNGVCWKSQFKSLPACCQSIFFVDVRSGAVILLDMNTVSSGLVYCLCIKRKSDVFRC